MKKIFPLLTALVLLLTACGGPMTLSYGSSTVTYDSGTWEETPSESSYGLTMKGSDSCWADLEGTLTMPTVSEMATLESSTLDGITVYDFPDGSQSYLAVPLENDTLYVRLGYDQERAPCLEAVQALAAMN